MSAGRNPVADRMFAALALVPGAFVDGRRLAKAGGVPFDTLSNWIKIIRAGNPQVAIEGVRGQGYRIVPAGIDPLPDFEPVAIKGREPAAPSRTETILADRQQAIWDLLVAARGRFVAGPQLAQVAGIKFNDVHAEIRALQARHPDERFEPQRGGSYRLLRSGQRMAEKKPRPAVSAPAPIIVPEKSREGMSDRAAVYQGLRNASSGAKDRVALLAPELVEPIANAALDEGVTIDAMLAKLVWLGWEVERDNLATGAAR